MRSGYVLHWIFVLLCLFIPFFQRYKEVSGSAGGKRKLKEAIDDEAPSRKHTRAEITGGKRKRK